MYKCKYFAIHELVCKHVYDKFGEKAWEFFDKDFLEDLDTIREILGVPVVINTWKKGGQYSESGNRCPKCSIVAKKIQAGQLYMSMHNLFGAMDMKPKGMTIKEAVKKVQDNAHRLKTINRIEDPNVTTSWLHVDKKGHGNGIRIFIP